MGLWEPSIYKETSMIKFDGKEFNNYRVEIETEKNIFAANRGRIQVFFKGFENYNFFLEKINQFENSIRVFPFVQKKERLELTHNKLGRMIGKGCYVKQLN
jgi:hypothetical protein